MDQFDVVGGKRLKGKIKISGSKNAALPCLFATLLTDQTCILRRVPDLADIDTTVRLLKKIGKKISIKNGVVTVRNGRSLSSHAPYELVRRMRAGALAMGPLLARKGRARVSLPGGCAIGARPVNYHLDAFERMGVRIEIKSGYVEGSARRLSGSIIKLPFASVGATENIMMAAALAKGKTVIQNAAREPEISDLGNMLREMGLDIKGQGTSTITIRGKSTLNGVDHFVIPDRIEAGTYMIAAAITKGHLLLEGVDLNHLNDLVEKLKKTGIEIKQRKGVVSVKWRKPLKPVNARTKVYPGFPTDMQAQWMVLMALTKGRSKISETVFENRFLHVNELHRFGANIELDGQNAMVTGVPHLEGCTAMVSDLRAGAALVLAALAAKGKSEILRVYHLDRGYESLEIKLRKVGARINRKNPNKKRKA